MSECRPDVRRKWPRMSAPVFSYSSRVCRSLSVAMTPSYVSPPAPRRGRVRLACPTGTQCPHARALTRRSLARRHPPALAAAWQPRCTSAAHAALARRPGPMAKVMVVDDAQSDLKLMESILRGAGHEVVSLTDGEELEDQMQAEHPDVLLLDIVMPRRNGYEILRALRRDARTRTTPVVLVSSKNQESDRAWGKKQGADEYLSKPFTSDQLLSVVSRFAR